MENFTSLSRVLCCNELCLFLCVKAMALLKASYELRVDCQKFEEANIFPSGSGKHTLQKNSFTSIQKKHMFQNL